MNRVWEKKAWWIGATATGFFGVALLKLVSPTLAGMQATLAAAAGYGLVLAAMFLMAFATRRDAPEIDGSEESRPGSVQFEQQAGKGVS